MLEEKLYESDINYNEHRYSRQIIVPGVGIKNQIKLRNSKIVIIGMGGLGCPVLMYLANTGILEIGIVDYDRVEITNLQRQILHKNEGDSKVESAAKFISEMNPHVKIIKYDIKLTENNINFLKDYDIVIDYCDSIRLRYCINDFCVVNKINLVSGSVLKWEGQVFVFPLKYSSDDIFCYRCMFPQEKSNVCSCETSGVIRSMCGVIGSLQATEVFKMIINDPKKSYSLFYKGTNNSFTKISQIKVNKCKICKQINQK
ncbi:UBA4 [Hepatospora eriocheir]|uniref:UBA4 n=1 Tax=Hepatospora eriocheir TaxID=1081669 RepID=A0A1X0QKK1_9MICR|nr:UBA4 [Hepatospora eriocheir]